MHFSLSEEQNILYNTAREFGEETIAPNAIEWEKKEEIPRKLLKEAGTLGLGGIIVSEGRWWFWNVALRRNASI